MIIIDINQQKTLHLRNPKQFLVFVMPILHEIVVNIITLTPVTISC